MKKIQLAIQGGGAKLVTLLAAARAIQELHDDIEVTRIIGTSAGAIAGLLLAAKVDIRAFRGKLQAGLGRELSRSLAQPKKSNWMNTALSGSPIWSTNVLKRIIEDVLKDKSEEIGMPLKTLKDLKLATGVELRVVAGNLTSSLPMVYSPEGRNIEIVTALLDSTAIPVFFRTWKDGAVVDGGLVQNFPWEELVEGTSSDFGPIFGISFEVPNGDIPRTRFGYVKALLNLAMDSNTERARNKLGPDRVLTLPAVFDTFDFDSGLGPVALSDHFTAIFETSKRWFIQKAINQQPQIGPGFWEATSLPVMEKLGRMYRFQHASKLLKYHFCSLEITARGLLSKGEADVTTHIIRFTPDSDLYCHSIALSQNIAMTAFKESTVVLFDESGSEIGIEYLPMLDHTTPERREVLLVFDRVLPARSGPYSLKIQDTVLGLTKTLLDNGEDTLLIKSQRTVELIDETEIVFHLPKVFRGSHMCTFELEGTQTTGRFMKTNELSSYNPPGPDWTTLGWIDEGIDSRRPFGPKIILRRAET